MQIITAIKMDIMMAFQYLNMGVYYLKIIPIANLKLGQIWERNLWFFVWIYEFLYVGKEIFNAIFWNELVLSQNNHPHKLCFWGG